MNSFFIQYLLFFISSRMYVIFQEGILKSNKLRKAKASTKISDKNIYPKTDVSTTILKPSLENAQLRKRHHIYTRTPTQPLWGM